MASESDIENKLDSTAPFLKACVLAIGMFDGLHRGHARVLAKCAALAKKLDAIPAILTFDPHPSAVISMPHPPAKMIFNSLARAKMFVKGGAKKVFVKNFDKKFAATSPENFADFLAEKFPNLRGIVTGENFLFGKNAKGDATELKKICKARGWEYAAIARLKSGGKRISSTRLRSALSEGKMGEYARLAGRFYQASGKVKSGRKLGRKLGFPTLNVAWNPDCKPPFGAYAVEVESKNGKIQNGVASYGTSPSIEESEPLVEVNILGKTSLKTGSEIEVRFLKFLRPQKKFDSLCELKNQIAKDKEAAIKFFSKKSDKLNLSKTDKKR